MTTTRKLINDDRGAIVVMGVFMACFLVGTLWYLMGIGDAAIYAQQMSQAADATAFAGAVYHARGMNVISMLNIIMAATVTILVGSKVLGELLRKVEWEARAVCNQPAQLNAQGEVVDPKPGSWACPIAQAAADYLAVINNLVGIIDDYGDGMMVGLSRGQEDVARDLPLIAQAKLTQERPIVNDYIAVGAPLVSGEMFSASMDPPDVRLGLPVENEPFELMCMRGQDLVEDVVLAAIAPLMAQLPKADSFLRVSHVLPFISSFPPAYCMGNGMAWNVDVMDVEDLCNRTLEEIGVAEAGSHPKPHRQNDYNWCPSGNYMQCIFGGNGNGNNDDDDNGNGNSSSSGAGGASGGIVWFNSGMGAAGSDIGSGTGGAGGGATFADGGSNTGGDTSQEDCEENLETQAAAEPPPPPQAGLDLRDPALKQGKRIYGPARNGDDHFQVWGVVAGSNNFIDRSADGVYVAALNGPAPAGDLSWAEQKGAQAEFYYDQTWAAAGSDKCWKVNNNRVYVAPGQCQLTWASYKDVVLWNMRWRARLRRLNEDSGNAGAAAVVAALMSYLDGLDGFVFDFGNIALF